MAQRDSGHRLIIPKSLKAEEELTLFFQDNPKDTYGTHLDAIIKDGRKDVFREMSKKFVEGCTADFMKTDEFAELAARNAPWNQTHSLNKEPRNIPDNSNIISGEELQRVRKQLLSNLRLLREAFYGKKPVVLMDYYDESDTAGCVTATMLRDVIRSLLGESEYEKYVTNVRANLRTDESPMVNDKDKYKKQFEHALGAGGIVIGGGTFNDADDIHGTWFQENIMKRIIETPDARAFMECWSTEVMLRALGKAYGIDIFILRGMLHWGFFPTQVLNDRSGLFSRIFRRGERRTAKITSAYTHGDWAVFLEDPMKKLGGWYMGDWDEDKKRNKGIQIIASDVTTGMPVGFISYDGRFVLFGGHAEVNRYDDAQRIREFTRTKMGRTLRESHRVSRDDVADNFFPFAGVKNLPLMQRDLGEAFIGGILLKLSTSLLNDLK